MNRQRFALLGGLLLVVGVVGAVVSELRSAKPQSDDEPPRPDLYSGIDPVHLVDDDGTLQVELGWG